MVTQHHADDPVRRIAHDAATDSVPVDTTDTATFDEWTLIVQDLADDIERQLRAEVDA